MGLCPCPCPCPHDAHLADPCDVHTRGQHVEPGAQLRVWLDVHEHVRASVVASVRPEATAPQVEVFVVSRVFSDARQEATDRGMVLVVAAYYALVRNRLEDFHLPCRHLENVRLKHLSRCWGQRIELQTVAHVLCDQLVVSPLLEWVLADLRVLRMARNRSAAVPDVILVLRTSPRDEIQHEALGPVGCNLSEHKL